MKALLLAVAATTYASSALAADPPSSRFAITLGYSAQSSQGDDLIPFELGSGYPADSEVENSDDGGGATLGLSWFVTRNIAVELWGATASDNDVEIDVENGTDVGVASYRTRPLAVSVQYHFNDLLVIRHLRFTPFVGLGYHHTEVSKVRSNASLSDYAGLEIDSGGGLAATAGLDMSLGEHWYVRSDVRYLSWSSESKVAGASLVDGDMETLFYGASIGIRF
jgi:outer membrane protein W